MRTTVEYWIVNARRATCGACELKDACHEAGIIHRSLMHEESQCPKGLHLSASEARHRKAFPPDAEPISGCCDRMD